MGRIPVGSSAEHSRWLTWCAAVLGASLSASLAIFDPVVRTQVGKLGAVNSYTLEVRVLNVRTYRTAITVRPPEDPRSRAQALSRAWRIGLAVALALIGGSVGAAIAQVLPVVRPHRYHPGEPILDI